MTRFIYLHGFASSRRSTDAVFFSGLLWLDSGHEVVDQLETMWKQTTALCGLGPP